MHSQKKYCWSKLEIIKKESPDILGVLSSKGGFSSKFSMENNILSGRLQHSYIRVSSLAVVRNRMFAIVYVT